MHDSPAEILRLVAHGAEATLSTHGGQLLSWRSADGVDQLYRSPMSQPADGRSVRGGTPVCWPQFAARGPLAKHGFARNHRWRVLAAPTAQHPGHAVLGLDSAGTPGLWSHPFALTLAVTLGAGWLELELGAHNPGPDPWHFTGALHTYLAVDDVRQVRLHGLQSAFYEDALDANRLRQQADAELRFTGELDRAYLGPAAELRLERPGSGSLLVSQLGFTDTVVWNPGPQKAAGLGDMPAADWLRMVCVEAAVVGTPVQVLPGATWSGRQRLERTGG